MITFSGQYFNYHRRRFIYAGFVVSYSGMRQRTVRSRDKIIEDCRAWLVEKPEEMPGKWAELFGNTNPLCVEIGSGKGFFLTQMALRHPEWNFVAIEGGPDIAIRILQKAKELDLRNLRVIPVFVNDARDFFAEGEVSQIYVNFCDPWPKARHAKRRLVFRGKLEAYKVIVAQGAKLAFRTDNDELFEFGLEEFEAAGLRPEIVTRDLHAEDFFASMIPTEYETKFAESGKNINYALVCLK